MNGWGVCDCGKWGDAPKEFDERVHFLKCSNCGSAMYFTIVDPKAAGYRDRNKVVVGTMPQKGYKKP